MVSSHQPFFTIQAACVQISQNPFQVSRVMFTFGRVLPSPAARSKEYGTALCLPCNPLGKYSAVAALLPVFNNLYPSLEKPQSCDVGKKKFVYARLSFDLLSQ